MNEEYTKMAEKEQLQSVPDMEEKIIEGLNTPIEECIKENEVIWQDICEIILILFVVNFIQLNKKEPEFQALFIYQQKIY